MINNLRKGFTLIELLIVIVIIGVLAVTVLSAINPIEQIKKAQDAGKRSDSAELLNALERYYTAFQMYPWDEEAVDGDKPPMEGTTGIPVVHPTSEYIQDWLNDPTASLIAVDELKEEFAGRVNLEGLYVYWSNPAIAGGTDLVRVCFAPESQTNMALATWDDAGEKPCVASETVTCFQCVPE